MSVVSVDTQPKRSAIIPAPPNRKSLVRGDVRGLILLAIAEYPGTGTAEISARTGIERNCVAATTHNEFVKGNVTRTPAAFGSFNYWTTGARKDAEKPAIVDASIETEAEALAVKAVEEFEADKLASEAERAYRIKERAKQLLRERGIPEEYIK